ncbi:MAG: hypothetical protein IJH39_12690 [Clostridia bacterium]|nr:hypothetical protein [Clostridia bacterium]
MKRLSYEEVNSLTGWEFFEVAEKLNDGWNRRGEHQNYYFDENYKTADWRIVDKKTNQEVYSYYNDFYTG